MSNNYGALPVVGRLTGRGNTANLEAVIAAKPDLVLDVGTIGPTYYRSPIAFRNRRIFPTC